MHRKIVSGVEGGFALGLGVGKERRLTRCPGGVLRR